MGIGAHEPHSFKAGYEEDPVYARRVNVGCRLAVALGVVALTAAAACSSSAGPASGPPDTTTRKDDSGPDAPDAPPVDDASVSASSAEGGREGGRDAAPAVVEDAPSDGEGATIPVADASAACVSFCTCMATNCANEVFAGGCLYQCTTQTNWDLPCRANMCSLVPSQPSNDHCTHAFGVSQCLDE
jgi:hypothetical protein